MIVFSAFTSIRGDRESSVQVEGAGGYVGLWYMSGTEQGGERQMCRVYFQQAWNNVRTCPFYKYVTYTSPLSVH